MKSKIIFCSALLTACFFSMHVGAQIKVINTGKVGVGLADTIVPLSTLSIGSAGQNNAKLSEIYWCYQKETTTAILL